MKIHKEGATTILMALIFAVLLGGTSRYFGAPPVLYWILFSIPMGLAVFFICFFREPKRTPTGDSRKITAPADGKVVIIQEVEEPEYFHGRRLQISVFMSFFDVHVNWAPVSGIISFYRYHRGTYLAAWHSKSSTKNERTTIVFKNEDGTEVLCRQIGFIKFGSRADVFLPLGTKVNVAVGDKVRGAETIIAELAAPAASTASAVENTNQ